MSNKLKLNYDDISVIPSPVTTISHRSECNPYDEDGFLPIFAAPMSSVVSWDNFGKFINNHIRPVLPRTYGLNKRLQVLGHPDGFVAFSLDEIENIFNGHNLYKYSMEVAIGYDMPINICIDIANGHMKRLLDVVSNIKKEYGDKIRIMTGNVANPKTYSEYESAGVDYMRAGIGGGSACLTSSNVSVHYPYFSLLEGLREEKERISGNCKIIADGNIRGYRDIQKALIYADYVMIGGLFNKAIESGGKTIYGNFYWNICNKKIINPFKTLLMSGKEVPVEKYGDVLKDIKSGKLKVYKEFYGMSTKRAQQQINSADTKAINKTKTSEGLVKLQEVEYDIKGWAENETDYLRSAMSYTDSRTLDDYKKSNWVRLTQIRYNY